MSPIWQQLSSTFPKGSRQAGCAVGGRGRQATRRGPELGPLPEEQHGFQWPPATCRQLGVWVNKQGGLWEGNGGRITNENAFPVAVTGLVQPRSPHLHRRGGGDSGVGLQGEVVAGDPPCEARRRKDKRGDWILWGVVCVPHAH